MKQVKFTTINGTHFASNESYTYFYMFTLNDMGTLNRKRISKKEFEAAQREDELERKMAAEQETTELVLTENDNMVTITPEDIERDARELERYIEEAEESNTDLEVAEIAEEMLDAETEDNGISLEKWGEDCQKLLKKEKEKKIRKERKAKAAKKNAFFTSTEVPGLTLTEKQVSFILHLPDTMFWGHGLESEIWVDCLCDDIKGQFQNKPMTVGAMISTLCEKGLGIRATSRRDGRKCTSFQLTPMGKVVAAEVGLQ